MIQSLIKFVSAFSILCAFAFGVSAQTKVDEFFYPGEESVLARIDNYLVELQNAPGAHGYIIVYGPRNPQKGEVEEHIRQMPKYYENFRKFAKGRITLVNGGFRDAGKVTLAFWSVAPGEKIPEASDILDIKQVKFRKGKFRPKYSLYFF